MSRYFTTSVIISLWALLDIDGGHGFFARQFFDLGARTSNCLNWSLWSPCYSTETKRFTGPFVLPGFCYYNPNIEVILDYMYFLENVYNHYRSLNISRSACGYCSFQISCGRSCNHGKIFGNKFGVSEQLCKNVEQSDPCVVKSDEAYDPETGTCKIWPPLYSGRSIFDQVSPKWQRDVKDLKPSHCISVDRQCYCCCAPYKPDPCTSKCVLVPCSESKSFTSETLPTRRRRRFAELWQNAK